MRALIEKELLLEQASAGEVLDVLGERFQLREQETSQLDSTFWDTFDWRVWKSGGLLVDRPATADVRSMILHSNDGQDSEPRREIAWCEHDGRIKQIAWLAEGDELGMAEELPEALAELAPALSMLRLMPVLHLRESGRVLRVLDES